VFAKVDITFGDNNNGVGGKAGMRSAGKPRAFKVSSPSRPARAVLQRHFCAGALWMSSRAAITDAGTARAEEPGWSHGPCGDTEEPHPARRIVRLYRCAQGHSSALCELAVVAQGPARYGVHLSRPHRIYREIFRGGWRASAKGLCRCRARLARAGRI